MTTLNALATLAEYKAWFTMRGGSTSTDTADDAVIELLLNGASQYIERKSGRSFLPYVETRYYSVPKDGDLRYLELDADLLEVFSITNGDGNTIPSTEYKLQPKNQSPYRGIRLNGSSVFYWSVDSSGDGQDVISVSGIWGCHSRYSSRAWLSASTLAEDLDTSETGIDVASGTPFAVGNIARIENELSYLSNVATNTLTGTRGENGSTTATHANGTAVKIWQTEELIKTTCLQIAESVYSLRSGQASNGRITVTGAGIVIKPEEVPAMAQSVIESYRFRT